MSEGTFSIEHLSEGQFDLFTDGCLVKNHQASTLRKAIGSNELWSELSQEVGIDPILVSQAGTHILLDSGLGLGLDARSTNPEVSNIRTNLEIFGLKPGDIHHVVLTHLHHDHIAGLTFTDNKSRVQATLPNATVWVQKSEWEYALSVMDAGHDSGDLPYKLDDFYRLVADGRVQFIENPVQQIIDGVDAIRTGGHTPGHQIVRIKNHGKTAYYFGDLIPNEHYLGFRMVPDGDVDVTESRQIKMLLLKQAHLDDAELLFYHSVHLKQGKLTKDSNRQFTLENMRKSR